MDKTRPAHSEHANVIILPPIPYGLTLVAGILLHLWEPVRFFPELWIGHAVGWPVIVAAGLLL